ncbi:hypothetical protein SAMN05421639_102209 [Chryseobacterium shigense]|uniref:Uncharacterized protein n=2 Tax=Chryseobacterium TaxID=59732 RepID=A0A1N7I614_9FLAO|nr:hypothetical protein SAMN05444360_11492 [Chryseobacterium carnipullorum]SIS32420.1 hypothetical protein SAMN05421639_102209 [Chryseobacterium shigense]STD02755.1 Uncharacterised protein [Chryseobacterium carnipullorum]
MKTDYRGKNFKLMDSIHTYGKKYKWYVIQTTRIKR